MYVYFQVDPIDTPDNVIVKDYPALTAVTGSPFSGASLTDLSNGLWKVNVGAITGNWYLWINNDEVDPTIRVIGYGYASSDYVDVNGDAALADPAPWLASAPAQVGGTPIGSSTIEFYTGDVAPRTVACIDGDGNSVTLTGLTLEIVIEDPYSDDIQRIEAADIDISADEFTFTPSASVTAVPRTWEWSLRNVTAGKTLMKGLMPINYSAQAGSDPLPVEASGRYVFDGGSP